MSSPKQERRTHNHLYALRRVRGLRQKHVARLLGYQGTAMVSRLETGACLPTLKVALLMEIVLGAKLSEIYIDLYQDLEHVALTRSQQLPPLLTRYLRGRLLRED